MLFRSKAISEGFVYDGIYSSYRKRRFGSSAKNEPGDRFIVFLQNHDQIANTCHGHRLKELAPFEPRKLAAALVLCCPFVPLIFMGEEFDDDAPFLYFTSHGDPRLAQAVTEGRRQEFADFHFEDEFFDPQALETFEKSKINWGHLDGERHRAVLQLYRDLIALRKTWPCLSNCRKELVEVDIDEQEQRLTIMRSDPAGSRALLLCNFAPKRAVFAANIERGSWRLALWTAAEIYCGPANVQRPAAVLNTSDRPAEVVVEGHSAILYTHEAS